MNAYIDISDNNIKSSLLKGNIGLERESLRIMHDGHMSHTPHRFTSNPRISRDFCENQTEINTHAHDSIDKVMHELFEYTDLIWKDAIDNNEMIWPFSNPPYIKDEDDIPIARFYGIDNSKTTYREYLSEKYGRYKMTFSGIHFNYSFDDELLRECYRHAKDSIESIDSLESLDSYRQFTDGLYLDLAQKASLYGWLLVCLCSASPVMDISFFEKGEYGQSIFTGMSSVRCSENGYWNFFTPLLDYDNVKSYVDSINEYVNLGLIYAPSELYYPIRLKPAGVYTLDNIITHGFDHIELRMIDLNPMCYEGVDIRDVKFAKLFLIYLSSLPPVKLSKADQIQTVANFRNAARYELKSVMIKYPGQKICDATTAGIEFLKDMKSFYSNATDHFADDEALEIQAIIDFELCKLTDYSNRYAVIVKEQFGCDYVRSGIELAKSYERQFTDHTV